MYFALTKVGRILEKWQIKLILKFGMQSYQPTPFSIIHDQGTQPQYSATINKWNLISSHLPHSSYTALDVGCNIGYFSFNIAQSGADHVYGIDMKRGPLLVAEKLKLLSRVENVGFCTVLVRKDNVELLGQYDVILFLSIFHHLVYSRGMEDAKFILKCLIKKSRNTLFFESGQRDPGYKIYENIMPITKKYPVDSYFSDLLMECGAEEVNIIGESTFPNNEKRTLFKVTPSVQSKRNATS